MHLSPAGSKSAFAAALVATLLVVSLVGYYELTFGASKTSTYTATVTGLPTIINTTSDVFLTSCVVTGIGGFGLRVVSDSTGSPVTGANITAVDELGCDVVGQQAQTQIVHITSFTEGEAGWLTPVFPSRAEAGGRLNFTVTYQGHTYNFTTNIPPIGSGCVTLSVPSGNVTSMNVMNGEGSYCYQETATTSSK